MSKRHDHGKRRSGMQGNGGRFAPVNGHPSQETSPTSHSEPRSHAYRVCGTTVGQYSTLVSHNTDRIWREER